MPSPAAHWAGVVEVPLPDGLEVAPELVPLPLVVPDPLVPVLLVPDPPLLAPPALDPLVLVLPVLEPPLGELLEPDVGSVLDWLLQDDVLLGDPVLVAVLEPLVVSIEALVAVVGVPDSVPQPSAPVAAPAPVVEPLAVWVVLAGSMLAPPAALVSVELRRLRLSFPFRVLASAPGRGL